MTTDVATPRPTELTSRALGPDLARGTMLLFVALANSHYFLQGRSFLGGFPRDGSGLDAVVIWLISTFVDGRAFPMFGLLFGYGVAQIVRRQHGAEAPAVRRLLWRRGTALVAIGILHALLLYAGDILAAYGVLLFAGAWAVRWKDRWLLVVAAGFLVLGALPGDGSMTISADPPDLSMLPPDVGTMFVERSQASLYVALLGPIGFVAPFAVGIWAGRRRILEEPRKHRRLLVAVAAVGIGAAVLGAQPIALVHAGVTAIPSDSTLERLGPLHDTTGVLGGAGYAALLTLIGARLRPGRVVHAIGAVGQRSMTCYLAQSVVWTVAFTPFLLDLSDDLGVAATALLAVATWTATVAMADWMRRSNRRGPFEVLVRRVTYHQANGVP